MSQKCINAFTVYSSSQLAFFSDLLLVLLMSFSLIFEQRKFTLKCYWTKMQLKFKGRYRRKFHSDPSTRIRVSWIRNKFEADGIVHNVHKVRSGRTWISTTPCEARKGDRKFSQKFKKPIEMLTTAWDCIAWRCQQRLDNND